MDKRQLIFTAFNGNAWQGYSLKELPKLHINVCATEVVNNKEDKTLSEIDEMLFQDVDKSSFECIIKEKTVLNGYFYCKHIDKTFINIIEDLQRDILSSSVLYMLKIQISTTHNNNSQEYQNYTSIKNFEDIRFIENSCYIMTDDILQVIDIATLLANYLI